MCGIAGIVKYKNSMPHKEAIRKMTASIHHRGPDSEGFFETNIVALGHKRLSIIDLSDASVQPMVDCTGRFVIVFNGEIYNYVKLRKLLSDYPYRTNGDTEVILAAYSKWGADCVKELSGMFAFAIWDNRNNE